MPLAAAIVPAVIGAGATLYASGQAKKAAGQALDAQTQANQQALQAQQANFDRIYGLNQPFVAGGGAAFNQLLQRLGVSGGSQGAAPSQAGGPAFTGFTGNGGQVGGSTNYDWETPTGRVNNGPISTGQGTPVAGGAPTGGLPPSGPEYPGAPYATGGGGGQFDAATYLAQNPDVAAEARNHPDMTPEQYAASHYQEFGQKEGRAAPMTPSTPITQVTPDLMNAQRPDVGPAPVFTRPADLAVPDIGTAPSVGDYFKDGWYQKSPGYDWALKQGLDAVNAAGAARGRLRSGGTLQALQREGIGFAQQDYNNAFQRQLSLLNADRAGYDTNTRNKLNIYQYGQGRADNNFVSDRGYGTDAWRFGVNRSDNNFNADRQYQTGRYDTNIGNLFDLTRIGVGAAGNVAGAGTTLANNQTDLYGSSANAASNAAYNRAAANNAAAGGIARGAGNIFSFAAGGGFGGGGGGFIDGSQGRFGGSTYGDTFTGGGMAPLPGNVSGMTYNVPRIF